LEPPFLLRTTCLAAPLAKSTLWAQDEASGCINKRISMSDDPDLHETVSQIQEVGNISSPSSRAIENTTIVRTIIMKPGDTSPDGKIVHLQTSSTVTSNAKRQGQPAEIVSFDRRELDQILRVYGFKVADGEWKDYAIDMLKDRAVFSVFRRANDTPLHCIEKDPKLARKQGMYSVTGSDGRILKRGHDLETVLKVLEKRRPKLRVV
jgi:hypothetical protein